MIELAPLDTLYDAEQGNELPLPPALARLYGQLRFPLQPGRPYVAGNFVTTLDGVVSLNLPGQSGGGQISGFNAHDHMVMGLLRAVADVVIVGAGTLRTASKHLWTAAHIYPALAEQYAQLRMSLGKSEPPLNVVITARGEIDMKLRVFQSGEVPVLIVTTAQGAQRIYEQDPPATVRIEAVQGAGALSARAILAVVDRVRPSELILTEGGPQLIGDFFAEHCLDELFLTLAPQVAGRDDLSERPGLIAGKLFAPSHPVWGTLIGVKQGGSHLFLRYLFAAD